MMVRVAVLIDERDRRLGKIAVSPSVRAIAHADSLFVRTEEIVALTHGLGGRAIVFREAELIHRSRLDPI